jgi:hypothetical protein
LFQSVKGCQIGRGFLKSRQIKRILGPHRKSISELPYFIGNNIYKALNTCLKLSADIIVNGIIISTKAILPGKSG